MALPCDSTNFVTDAACYTSRTINPKQQKALQVYALALLVAANAGTDYTLMLSTDLVEDAPCNLTQDQKVAAMINLYFAWADGLSVDFPATLDGKLAITKCLMNVDDEKLNAMILLLNCKLFSAFGAA